ncbi:hypothetical protein [Marinobacter sp.]|uniref:hypothetical protein n=1 Tax=Marinobacter sp. TaxID=50741 RepID=UPI00384B194C
MKETVIQALFSMALLCFSMLVGLVGIGFLVAGLYMGLTHWLQPAGAAAATGLIMLVATLILLAICKALVTPSKRQGGNPEAPPDELSGLMREAAALGSVTRQLEHTVQEHKPLVTAGTFAVGFYLGVNPKARRALGRALSDAASHGIDSARRGREERS